jgi:hypothetical protein
MGIDTLLVILILTFGVGIALHTLLTRVPRRGSAGGSSLSGPDKGASQGNFGHRF